MLVKKKNLKKRFGRTKFSRRRSVRNKYRTDQAYRTGQAFGMKQMKRNAILTLMMKRKQLKVKGQLIRIEFARRIQNLFLSRRESLFERYHPLHLISDQLNNS